MSTLGYGTETPPTPETWLEFAENQGNNAPLCYVDGVYDMLMNIEKIAQLSDFENMKTELTNLYEERRSFVAYALKNIP